MKVKVCGMRDPDNIMAVSRLQPDFMGFIFYPGSKRCADVDVLVSVLPSLSTNIRKVGVFVNEDHGVVMNVFHRLQLDHVQLHGNESPEYCNALHANDIRIIKAFQVGEDFDFDSLINYSSAEYFLFDTPSPHYGGTGRSFPWDRLISYRHSTPYFLSGGIGPASAEQIRTLELPRIPHAVDINSGFEIGPGMKNIDQVSHFINLIRYEVRS